MDGPMMARQPMSLSSSQPLKMFLIRPAGEPWLFVAGEIDEYSYKSLIRALASVASFTGLFHNPIFAAETK